MKATNESNASEFRFTRSQLNEYAFIRIANKGAYLKVFIANLKTKYLNIVYRYRYIEVDISI